jgi:hypothetical protein
MNVFAAAQNEPLCLAIHTTDISQFAATFNDARNQELGLSSESVVVVVGNYRVAVGFTR